MRLHLFHHPTCPIEIGLLYLLPRVLPAFHDVVAGRVDLLQHHDVAIVAIGGGCGSRVPLFSSQLLQEHLSVVGDFPAFLRIVRGAQDVQNGARLHRGEPVDVVALAEERKGLRVLRDHRVRHLPRRKNLRRVQLQPVLEVWRLVVRFHMHFAVEDLGAHRHVRVVVNRHRLALWDAEDAHREVGALINMEVRDRFSFRVPVQKRELHRVRRRLLAFFFGLFGEPDLRHGDLP
mmetsp:Transcript_1408/g.3968  ORF Transcript_1408/g.3968 Transcript_1408/m.3968 type:complete len:233 (-) Transcript_1408:384-1082(-)